MLIVKNGGWRAWPCMDVDGGSVLLVVDGHCLLDIAAIGAWGEDVKNLDGQQRQCKFSINSVHWKSNWKAIEAHAESEWKASPTDLLCYVWENKSDVIARETGLSMF